MHTINKIKLGSSSAPHGVISTLSDIQCQAEVRRRWKALLVLDKAWGGGGRLLQLTVAKTSSLTNILHHVGPTEPEQDF
jgi:hypothetical protein